MPRTLTPKQVAALTPAQANARENRRLHYLRDRDALKEERQRQKMKKEQARAQEEEEREKEPKKKELHNPLEDLPERERAELFARLRDCPYYDAVVEMLREQGIETTAQQLQHFFVDEARHHWETRITRAALEANALIQLAEENPANFSSGMLAALGQETFRQIASGQAQPESMNRMALLFLRAKSDERAAQMGELKREKMRREMQGTVELAFEKIAAEVERNPAARAAFETLRRELGPKEDA